MEASNSKLKPNRKGRMMAITGERFLAVSGAEVFTVSRHALDRMFEHTHLYPTRGLAGVMFGRGRQVKPSEMLLLGYRPGYDRRLKRGEKSWYFHLRVFAQDLIAVIGEGDRPGEYVWLTTYAPTGQPDRFALAEPEALYAA
jgi:hypothetical protein